MRIWIVHYNPQEPGVAGGAESAIRDQKRALEMLGHEVELVFDDPRGRMDKPDVIHFHTIHVFQDPELTLLRWAQDKKIPHILSLHDYWPFCFGRMLLREYDQSCSAVEGLCDKRCKYWPAPESYRKILAGTPTITFNPYSAEIFRRNGIKIDHVVPHGIDTDFFKPDPTKRADGKIITVTAWPQYPTKGMHILAKALRMARLSAECVSGVGRDVVRDKLQEAQVFVFPSCYQETFGLCLTEALSSGCACISSDVAGAKYQMQRSGNGEWIYPARDPRALADLLVKMMDCDREDIGLQNRIVSENLYSLENMGRRYAEIYEAL
jgi:glycosyltransferase involved in cell wall biosynthesis